MGLLREGLEWYFGNNFRVRNEARGKMLVEVAAKGGLPLAVARCQQRGWGGYDGSSVDKEAAAATAVLSAY
eukprot:SAG31_NODE_23923_length_492_cov_2.320611_1_plen_71_part_00